MNEEAMRKAFEAWATKSGSVSLRPWLGGGTESAPYHYDSTNTAWLAWRAATRAAVPEWLPIESAPRGSGEGGPGDVNHPDYIEPPRLLLATDDGLAVGYYDWYYHQGYGHGAEVGVPAWREAQSGEPLYATHWMPLPAAPEAKP